MDWSEDSHQTTRVVDTAPARFEFEAIPKAKVYEEVARQLERHIVEELKPGDMLPPERELAEMFSVSRSSVRDAIRRLEAAGLVQARQGTGTVVCEVSSDSLARPLTGVLVQKRRLVGELLDVRKIIEPPLARRAASHISEEEIANLAQILHRQEDKVRQGQLAIEEDSDFHFNIALAADNSVVLKVLDVLMNLLRETRERSLQVEGRKEKSLAGHRRILAALKRHDPEAAEAAMLRHLEEIEAIVLKQL